MSPGLLFHFSRICLLHQKARIVHSPTNRPPKTKKKKKVLQLLVSGRNLRLLISPLKIRTDSHKQEGGGELKFSNFSDGCFWGKALTDKPLKEYMCLRENCQRRGRKREGEGKVMRLLWDYWERDGQTKGTLQKNIGGKVNNPSP